MGSALMGCCPSWMDTMWAPHAAAALQTLLQCGSIPWCPSFRNCPSTGPHKWHLLPHHRLLPIGNSLGSVPLGSFLWAAASFRLRSLLHRGLLHELFSIWAARGQPALTWASPGVQGSFCSGTNNFLALLDPFHWKEARSFPSLWFELESEIFL